MAKKKAKKASTKRLALQEREKADAALRKAAQAARVASLEWIDRLKEDPESAELLQEQMTADLQRVYNIPHSVLGRSAGRQRYRELGHYAERLVAMAFGTHTAFKAAAQLEETPTQKRGTSRSARLYWEQKVRKYHEQVIRPYARDPFLAFKDRDVVRFICASDHHSKKVDPFAMRVLLDMLRWVQPDLHVINGDAHEFQDLSTHRKFPGHFDLTPAEEVDYCVKHIYAPAKEAAPKARHVWVMGNHDYRFVRYVADRASDLSGLSGMNLIDLFRLRELEIDLVCRSNFLAPTSKLRRRDRGENWLVVEDCMVFTHGEYTGRGAGDKHHNRFGMSGCCGHAHNPAQTFYNSLSCGPQSWVISPMMAGHAVGRDYVSMPSQWQMGFVVGTIDRRTKEVQQNIITVGETATFGGRTWRINKAEREARRAAWEIR